MDTQDLRGHLRGLCLVTVVRCVRGPVKHPDLQDVLHRRLGNEIARFTEAAAAFSGVEVAILQTAVEELYAADDEFLRPENLNMQLGLLSRHPFPVFPFITEGGLDGVALLRTVLDVSKNLIHSTVRLRMQIRKRSPPGIAVAPPVPDGFWDLRSVNRASERARAARKGWLGSQQSHNRAHCVSGGAGS